MSGSVDWKNIAREILERLDIVAEYERLGVQFTKRTPNKGGWLECYAFGREESSASAAVNVGGGKFRGRYKDMGGSGLSGSFFEIAAMMGPFADWREARDYYASRAGIEIPAKCDGDGAKKGSGGYVETDAIKKWKADFDANPFPSAGPRNGDSQSQSANQKKNKKSKSKSRQNCEEITSPSCPLEDKFIHQQWSDAIADHWCREWKPGTSRDALVASGAIMGLWPRRPDGRIGNQKPIFAIPFYGPELLASKPCGYAMTHRSGQQLPIFQGKGNPPLYRKVKNLAGSVAGWIGKSGLERLPNAKYVWVVEGVSDWLAMESLIPEELRQFHAVLSNSNGASERPRDEMIKILAGKIVFVIRDCDHAGQGIHPEMEVNRPGYLSGAPLWASEIARYASESRNVVLPFEIVEKHGNDLRDWKNAGGTFEQLFGMALAAPIVPPPEVSAIAGDESGTAEMTPEDFLCEALAGGGGGGEKDRSEIDELADALFGGYEYSEDDGDGDGDEDGCGGDESVDEDESDDESDADSDNDADADDSFPPAGQSAQKPTTKKATPSSSAGARSTAKHSVQHSPHSPTSTPSPPTPPRDPNDFSHWGSDDDDDKDDDDEGAYGEFPDSVRDRKLSTRMEERMLRGIGIDVLGEVPYTDYIELYSTCHRKTQRVVVRNLTIPDLYKICGPPARDKINESPEPDADKCSLLQVKKAIAIISGFSTLRDCSKRGPGVWRGKSLQGNETREIIIVNGGEVMKLNSRREVKRLKSPRSGGLLLDIGRGERWCSYEDLMLNLDKAKNDRQWVVDTVNQITEVFSRWSWRNQAVDPMVMTGMVLATWIQTLWKWRPMVAVIGSSGAGKTTLLQAIGGADSSRGLFGALAMLSSQSSEAGIRQAIKHDATILMLDEFEDSKERAKILNLLRTASRGAKMLKGSTSQSGESFGLQQIAWVAAIEVGLKKEPDRNRFIMLELVPPPAEKANKLQVPDEHWLADHGQKLLAIALAHAHIAVPLAVELKSTVVEGIDRRVIESYAVPASILATCIGGGKEAAVTLLKNMLTGVEKVEQGRSDADDLMFDIFASRVDCGHGLRMSVSQILSDVSLYATHRAQLEQHGIAVCNDVESGMPSKIFFAHKFVTRHLLRGTEWESQSIDQMLKRIPGAKGGRMRLSGSHPGGVFVPLSHCEERYLGSQALGENTKMAENVGDALLEMAGVGGIGGAGGGNSTAEF